MTLRLLKGSKLLGVAWHGDPPEIMGSWLSQYPWKPYPLVNQQKAIENGHRNSGFSHEKHGDFTIVMLVYQRVDDLDDRDP